MAFSPHVLQVNKLFGQTALLYIFSIVLTSTSIPTSLDQTPVAGASNSSLKTLAGEDHFLKKRALEMVTNDDQGVSRRSQNKQTINPSMGKTSLVNRKWFSRDNPEFPGADKHVGILKRRRGKKKTTTRKKKGNGAKISGDDPVVIMEAQLYSVCSKSYVQIPEAGVNAIGSSDSPLTRLEIISEIKPDSVDFQLDPFKRDRYHAGHANQPRSRRRRRHSNDDDLHSHGHSHFYVKIRSSTSKRYICFNSLGNVISMISDQHPRCRLTEVYHNGAYYYRSTVNSSWFLQFNQRGLRIKTAMMESSSIMDDSETPRKSPETTTTTTTASNANLSEALLHVNDTSLETSTPTSSSSSSLSISDQPISIDQRLPRQDRKYSRCQGFIKRPISSSPASSSSSSTSFSSSSSSSSSIFFKSLTGFNLQLT